MRPSPQHTAQVSWASRTPLLKITDSNLTLLIPSLSGSETEGKLVELREVTAGTYERNLILKSYKHMGHIRGTGPSQLLGGWQGP